MGEEGKRMKGGAEGKAQEKEFKQEPCTTRLAHGFAGVTGSKFIYTRVI